MLSVTTSNELLCCITMFTTECVFISSLVINTASHTYKCVLQDGKGALWFTIISIDILFKSTFGGCSEYDETLNLAVTTVHLIYNLLFFQKLLFFLY